MGSLQGLPMASVQLFSGDPAEAGRPGPKVIKAKAKELNLPSSFHPECYLHLFFCINDLIYHVNLFNQISLSAAGQVLKILYEQFFSVNHIHIQALATGSLPA